MPILILINNNIDKNNIDKFNIDKFNITDITSTIEINDILGLDVIKFLSETKIYIYSTSSLSDNVKFIDLVSTLIDKEIYLIEQQYNIIQVNVASKLTISIEEINEIINAEISPLSVLSNSSSSSNSSSNSNSNSSSSSSNSSSSSLVPLSALNSLSALSTLSTLRKNEDRNSKNEDHNSKNVDHNSKISKHQKRKYEEYDTLEKKYEHTSKVFIPYKLCKWDNYQKGCTDRYCTFLHYNK